MTENPFDGTPLPKGMKMPEPDLPDEDIGQRVTVSDVNYGKVIRDALSGVQEVELVVVAMSIDEDVGRNPVVRLEIEVMPKDEDS